MGQSLIFKLMPITSLIGWREHITQEKWIYMDMKEYFLSYKPKSDSMDFEVHHKDMMMLNKKEIYI